MKPEEKTFGMFISIPTALLLDERVTPNAKLLYGVILNLSNSVGYCFATNNYLAELLSWHKNTVSDFVVQLTTFGYLRREELPVKSGSERRLFCEVGVSVKQRRTPQSNGVSPLSQTTEHNKITLITEDNKAIPVDSDESTGSNTSKSKSRTGSKKSAADPAYALCVEVWLKEVHPGWKFSSVDGKAMKLLIDRMRDYSTRKRREEFPDQAVVMITEEAITNFFKHFCKRLPAFYKLQPLMVLATKFDSIIDQIKSMDHNGNGKKGNWNNPKDASAIIRSL